ncbi:hypothetical protein DRO97_05840 [Archaeoglobales archaeon]|nr:MAG: hypothetical protein DRO97_05840 [Archaeoglobales archaeon]
MRLELIGIKLKNYRSCRVFPKNGDYLEIGKFTTLIGKNDVGKSNILKAIYVVCKNKKLFIEDIHKGMQEKCEISLFFKVPKTLKDELAEKISQYSGNDIIEIKKVFEWSNGKLGSGVYFIEDKKVSYQTLEKYLPHVLFIPAVKNVEEETKFGRDTILSELFLPIIEKTDEEKSQAESIADLKRRLRKAIQQETQKFRNSLKKELSKMWDEVEDVTIDIPELKIEKAFNPQIKIKDKHIGKEIPITHRGSGVQRYLILAMLEIYRQLKIGKGYLLLFEEPEIYLHIGAQKKMCAILKDFSKEGRVIISTHSSIFVDKSDISTTYLLIKEDGETRLRKFQGNKEILEELGMSPSDIFLTNGIILVEGPSDVEIIKVFAESIFENWDEYNIAIIPIGGSNIEHQNPATLLTVNPNVVVILDPDVKSKSSVLSSKKETLKRKFENAGIAVYLWKKNGEFIRCIENLFTKDAIEKALNITLDTEITEYEDVPLKIGKKLVEKRVQHDPHFDKEKIKDGEFCRKEMYNRIRHGKKIAKKMVEIDNIPEDIKIVLYNILEKFGLYQC